jgi:hypothetical protein
MELNYRPQEHILIEIFTNNYVSIFGGYIRDMLLDEEPHDIDCMVDNEHFGIVDVALKKIGYRCIPNEDEEGFYKYEHDTLIQIDLVKSSFSYKDTFLSPETYPDCDVNNLYWFWDFEEQKYRMDMWVGCNDISYLEIIDRLQRKEKIAYIYPSCTDERLYKIQSKGFTCKFI